MGKVTLIGKSLALEGQVFTYIGTVPECGDCKLSGTCQNLSPGRRYRIDKVRDKEHDCPIYEDGKVVAVEVSDLPMEISVPGRKALESAIVTMEDEGCKWRWCENNRLCRMEYVPKGTKVLLVSVHEQLQCPKGLNLRRVLAEVRD